MTRRWIVPTLTTLLVASALSPKARASYGTTEPTKQPQGVWNYLKQAWLRAHRRH